MDEIFKPRSFSNQKPRNVLHHALILCEGEDEYDILTVLCNQKQISEEQISIRIVGRDALNEELRLLSKASSVQELACVYDVEEGAAIIDLNALLSSHSLSEKCKPEHRLMLPLVGNGSLETQIKSSLQAEPKGDVLCADQWLVCAKEKFPAAYNTTAKWDKAWLQVWLAARIEGSTAFSRVGFAIARSSEIEKTLLPTLKPYSDLLDSLVKSSHV